MTAPIWYDVTLPREKATDEELQKFIEALGVERYAYGREIGEGGYEHYQIRYVLKKPSIWNAQKAIWGPRGGHVSPTSREGHNFNYVEKEGEFFRSWEGPLRKFATIDFLPWQGQAVAVLQAQNDRQVAVIVDVEGNHGKSWLGKMLEARHIADYCPVNSGEASEYISYCFEYPSKAYVFDIPRSDTIKDKKQMWKAIESIKNGCLYERRYCPKKKWIDPPKILIFANEEPPYELLTKDRWTVYEIVKCGKLDILQTLDHY